MLRASFATEVAGGFLFLLAAMTAVLLLISMRKIYVTIRIHYPEWKPNLFFIALQVIAFVTPVIMCILCVIFYKPDISFEGTLTYDEMFMYCLFQVSISIVMVILLYVVTTYSLS